MDIARQSACAVTYRAISAGNEVEIRLVMRPERASMADAWERLAAAYDGVDPRSIEIEIREREALRPRHSARPLPRRPAPAQGLGPAPDVRLHSLRSRKRDG